ncbi:hypothetical protein A2673_00325 [Candidatus Kaiserbacteria bacterium RIFCSPHIGHO2_01_FULL_50_13]|uniref:phosphoribosylglycinamide formyltransferase 1 n=1 Tax=Candidatus Kaiserbacteria bacterium RIFCSPLOWO2_01_FULL_50_24 TaxID=1798507 RepID=A0A1F6EJ23_9BACT|nr:MAG: hypothetical protein A2673_00325 [Candidatus Kaiserbacteria bacterium RIFCSPHIGHO2_01_FULL_50_13]OGG73626.1 MAG: hypothetical protein A3A34_03045 [Candidatus Kaiserbacteria bacterium RIFCSPLOWO2_01_FULL_50_24]OGG81288.1 MAG: hypothetical protein A3H74_03915 [Candidatus Kaiserbacteria bacterium RIFCSPLOWO2_02_FULL_51_13]
MAGKPKLVVFSSGTKTGGPSSRSSELWPRKGGGSGFENLVQWSRTSADSTQTDSEKYEVVAVVSNHEHGDVRERAGRLGVPFVYFEPKNYSHVLENMRTESGEGVSDEYRRIVRESEAEWVALSGWLKKVEGPNPQKTFNIHPALLSQRGGPFDRLRASRFGGHGMYGRRVHEAVKRALDTGEITETGVSMHFVTDEYDRGPVFFEHKVPLQKGMSADDIAKAVNKAEHEWQPKITNLVVHGQIHWDGKDPKSLVVPPDLK